MGGNRREVPLPRLTPVTKDPKTPPPPSDEEAERLLALELMGGVDPGDNPLPGRLLIAAGAVDLAGEKQARDPLRLQARL